MNTPPAKSSIANAMRLLATTDPNTFRMEVGTKLKPVLNRLSGLELVRVFCYLLSIFLAAHRPFILLQTAASSAKEWQESQGYVQIMCRRLRDSAGLLEDHESSNDHLDEKY
jgi:nuclear pore complex protein Nup205